VHDDETLDFSEELEVGPPVEEPEEDIIAK
jgi:hypothetical protein